MVSFTHNDISYTIAIPVYPVNIIVDHFVFMNGNGMQTSERLLPNNLTEMFFNLGDRVSGKNNWDASTPEISDNIISGVRHTLFVKVFLYPIRIRRHGKGFAGKKMCAALYFPASLVDINSNE